MGGVLVGRLRVWEEGTWGTNGIGDGMASADLGRKDRSERRSWIGGAL